MLFRRFHASKLGAYVEKTINTTEVKMRYLFCLVISKRKKCKNTTN